MKSQKNNVTAFWKSLFACLLLSAFLIMPAQAEEERYVFERMWPELQQPWYFGLSDVAVDKNGNVYVADTEFHRIQKFGSDGTFITKWGSEGSGEGQFDLPQGIAVDSNGDIYVAEARNHRIQKFSSDGTFITKWGSLGSGTGQFYNPNRIAIDGNGNVYVADTFNHRIQKFVLDGTFISKWGSAGSGDGQFNQPTGIAVDSAGFVYVADTFNHRIQKFDSDGTFISKWGSQEGSGDGQFRWPAGIAVDGAGNVYVADTSNYRIQKFDSDGTFISKWGRDGFGNGQFLSIGAIAVDSNGFIYVADSGNRRIQKFASDGVFITKWGSGGSEDGQFRWSDGIAVDSASFVYVADTNNDRIQKFASDGVFIIKWGSGGSGDGQFQEPKGIVVDGAGNVYVADTGNYRIQKFASDGTFIAKWGSYGSGDGQLNHPVGITVDDAGFVYVADSWNNRIQKFASDGTFVTKWGSYGSEDGQFYYPAKIAVHGTDFVYVTESNDKRIQKFSSDGTFITKWGSEGSGDGQFRHLGGIAVDSSNFIYVADVGGDRIQKFSSDGKFITKFGEFGSDPGLLNEPLDVCVSPDGRVYVTDSYNNRIQVFRKAGSTQKISKAIIVAGSGPGDWNNLWDATQMCANYAYSALLYQGYTKENIYYLTHDANSEDRDAAATNAEFQKAITDWAKDADNVFIYMVGHGGEGTFRMGALELLQAADLDTWLDTFQGVIQGRVILVYDACRSGSFLSALKPPEGKQRILIASASSSQEAIFAVQGKVSFSFMFWASLFNGDSFYDCFKDAKKAVALTYLQASQLEANGNGVPNEEEDQEIARSVIFGNETLTAGDIPLITGLSPAQTLNGETSALIYAENITDSDGIGRVWAVIMPPGYSGSSPDIPVTTLPTVDLKSVGNNRYEGTYTGFDTAGVYNIAVFAFDRNVVIGDPVQTSVTQTRGAVLKGDINDDKAVNLADAVIALKVAAGLGGLPIRADYVSSGIDISGDSRIGTEEVIYILQKTAGLR